MAQVTCARGWNLEVERGPECLFVTPRRKPDEAATMRSLAEQLWTLLEQNFTYHPPKDGQPGKYAMLRTEFRNLAMELLQWCPPSRERSLALTALEEASMWANAAIARNE